MSTQILLISEQYLKEHTTITLNVDPKLLIPAIYDAQQLKIRPILGSSLFNEICNQVSASTLTSLNATLLNDYIQIATAKWTLHTVYPQLLYKIMNKSVVEKRSENSDSVDLKTLQWLMAHASNIAEQYSENLRLYLIQNTTSYPLYQNPGTGADVIRPSNKTWAQGMYLGNGKYYTSNGFSDLANECCD